jgi:hypothetical protein
MINPSNNQQNPNDNYQYACQLMIDQGMSPDETKSELLKRGMTSESADEMIYNVEEQMRLENRHKSSTWRFKLFMAIILIKVLFEIYKCSR